MRSLEELINVEEPGWELVLDWKKEATNKVEILKKKPAQAKKALLELQVTTRSPMGAITYETGGILIDDGWIRILGSGSKRLSRQIMSWNQGKSFQEVGEAPPFLLIADDVLGGFFAINGGAFGKEGVGKIFYFAPESLAWDNLEISYSEFIYFCFNGDLKSFYEGLRWEDWRKEVQRLHGDQAMDCYPYLFTKEGADINKVHRTPVPIEEIWRLHFGKKE